MSVLHVFEKPTPHATFGAWNMLKRKTNFLILHTNENSLTLLTYTVMLTLYHSDQQGYSGPVKPKIDPELFSIM